MNSFDDDELSIQLCKFGGPIVLFICTPIVAWILIAVTKESLDAGEPLSLEVGLNFLIVIPFIWFGVWMCRKGYGWFGGRK